MDEMRTLLKELISAPGLSGHEQPVRALIEKAWRPLTTEMRTSRLGNLSARYLGAGPGPRPTLLLAAHMDAIGLMVREIVDGFLRLAEIGGLDPRVLPGQMVTVHGRRDVAGMIVQPAAHLLPPDVRTSTVPLKHLFVDTGLSLEEVKDLVRVGDLISFAQPPLDLDDDLVLGHSLDNRASVVALTYCLQLLQSRSLVWDVLAVATSQEEETLAGAATTAFEMRPALAVAIDVTFGAGPGSSPHNTFPLGSGVTLGWGPNIHPALYRRFEELARRLEIPYVIEPMPKHSGTDAIALQVAAEGIPTMVLSIPIRYMHTPVEIVPLKDVLRAGRLLAEFAASLEVDYAENLVWDD